MKRPVLNDHIKEEIRDAADIVDVVSDYVKLKRSGNSFTGLCPFHNEKTPSFHVNPQLRIYKCFGCGAGGDVFNFVMDIEGIGFVEAMKWLADRFNVTIPEMESGESDAGYQLTEGVFHALRFAGVHFHQNLVEADEAAHAREYLSKRGFTLKTIRKFGIGYSLNSFDGLINDARTAGINDEYLFEAGLTKYSENSKNAFDVFRGRLMFPIFNAAGKVIAFGGRILRDDKGPKYINSPQTRVYNKSEALYGIHLAKNDIRKQQEVILVEGYTDVVSLWQAGIGNVVASSGTSLTVQQLQILKRYSPNLLMIYDADNAGQAAMIRGIELALQEGMDVRLLSLPDGEDPDSFVRKFGAEAFRNVRKKDATDFVTFKIRQAEASGSWDDPLKKQRVISDIVRSIALMPNEVGRETMILHLNTFARIGDRALFNELGLAISRQSRQPDISADIDSYSDRNRMAEDSNNPDAIAKTGQSGGRKHISGETGQPFTENPLKRNRVPAIPGYEKEIIRLLLTYGDRMIDYIGSNCNPDLFEHPDIRIFFEDIITRYSDGKPVSVDHYSGREHPYPGLTGDIVLDRYSISDEGNRKRGNIIKKDTDPFKTARGAMKTLKIHYLKKLHIELEDASTSLSGKEREEALKKQMRVRKELSRFETVPADELFAKENH
ncbi:MAG: DNA primase [Cyclonatronaceae bacterium]